ncbi:endonuclease domain-containing protein [Phenylobacterium aquaticum]|uniref:endonuclease domain-containing protein n=1 Tax=Phenylobacterium aquaticum TaxID=1763816 RepID=UPI0026EA81EA|nr:endonuclease domain-containing protein [Phenylobacterium aquaticum]
MPERTPGALHKSDRASGLSKRSRRVPTRAEAKLWKGLRRLEIQDTHFRRQAPIGTYVVDFICHSARLIIEVDGGVHALDQVALRDFERETWLKGRGYRVLRVSNDEVMSDITSVLERIVAALSADTPTPTPPRKGEGL